MTRRKLSIIDGVRAWNSFLIGEMGHRTTSADKPSHLLNWGTWLHMQCICALDRSGPSCSLVMQDGLNFSLRLFRFFFLSAVLVLADTKLIFFTALVTVSCFGLATKRVLITHRCFSYCWAVLTEQAFSASHVDPPVRQLRLRKKLARGTADPQLIMGYPTAYDVMLSKRKLGKEGRRKGCL